MAKKLIITIGKDGNISGEISGVKGKKCLDYTRLLESIVEGKVIGQEYTQEYYQEETHIRTSQ